MADPNPYIIAGNKQTKARQDKAYTKLAKSLKRLKIQRKLGYTINGLYKVVYEISTAGKNYD